MISMAVAVKPLAACLTSSSRVFFTRGRSRLIALVIPFVSNFMVTFMASEAPTARNIPAYGKYLFSAEGAGRNGSPNRPIILWGQTMSPHEIPQAFGNSHSAQRRSQGRPGGPSLPVEAPKALNRSPGSYLFSANGAASTLA